MKKPKAKDLELGNFALGLLGVNVAIELDNDGGWAVARQEPGCAGMGIGILGNWPTTVAVLLHEALELALVMRGLRYRDSDHAATDGSNGTIFAMSHPQFEVVVDDVGAFVSQVLPVLAKKYSKYNKDHS